MVILYVGTCKSCGFQVHSKDFTDFKRLMATHLNTSHGQDYLFVASIPLKDFEDFTVVLIRDSETIATLLSVFHNRGYWKAIRAHPQLQTLFSGLSRGENSLSEILRQHSARG